MSNSDKGFLGHPIGLAILFFTEMWERFSYYGMRALLTLYIASSIEDGGLGWTNAQAIALYGWYTMLVYLMSIPGGIVADKLLGQKKTVMIGGLLLCLGHGVLAIEALWAFYTGLILIIFGVGGLKPNISTMVGGLYKQGDIRRDKGFTIFYIGINVGAFLAGIVVGGIGQTWGWHYGFGLAGIGMLLGQIVFIWGQKYLKGVGNLVKEEATESTIERPKHLARFTKNPISLIVTGVLIALAIFIATYNTGDELDYNKLGYAIIIMTLAPFVGVGINIYKFELSKVERDRVVVLLVSFLIIIVFWGAFEQAGGLMNIYANEKIDRLGIPASVFQSVNSFFIMIFGTAVATFWAVRKRNGKEASSIFKMAVGTIVMGTGFIFMAFASNEASGEAFGKAALYWLILAYLLHTLGELSASPVSLSFITKLAPVQYVSIMMGLYFAATGFGNKLAGAIGEASQSEPIEVTFDADKKTALKPYEDNFENIEEDKSISFQAQIYLENNRVKIVGLEKKKPIQDFFDLDKENKERLVSTLEAEKVDTDNRFHATIYLEKDLEAKKVKENKGDAKDYEGTIRIEEIQSRLEFWTFTYITIFTVAFGLLLIVFLKKLKALTHGAEEAEKRMD